MRNRQKKSTGDQENLALDQSAVLDWKSPAQTSAGETIKTVSINVASINATDSETLPTDGYVLEAQLNPSVDSQ